MIQTDGTVEFESPKASISPHTSRDDFLASVLYGISKPLNQNEPWSRYSFPAVAAENEPFACDICFCSGAIYSMTLCSCRSEFGDSWSDFSVEKEQARHCFHKQLLEHLFGRRPNKHIPMEPDERDADTEFSFPWGSVSAATDKKASAWCILIKYGG